VRRTAGGLGSLARDAGLLTLIGVLCLAAASASAAPAPTVFRLSISGNAHQKWDHTAGPVPVGDCQQTVRSEAIRDVSLRTAHPVLVRFAGGRILATTVRGLTGTVTLSGANTTTQICGIERTESIADCAQTRRSFKGGTIGLVGPRVGTIGLGPFRNVRLQSASCPREPADVVKAPLGLVPGPLHVRVGTVTNPRIVRITLTASASRRKIYGAPEAGTLEQRAAWKVTLTRVQP
jgi:hypothetical protein